MKGIILAILIAFTVCEAGVDTFVYTLFPDSNFGDNPYIYVSYNYIGGDRAVGLIKWDIPSREVSNATMKLYCLDSLGPQEIWVSHALVPWDEDTVTWNDHIYLCAVAEHLHIVHNPESDSWFSIDITDTVNMWVRGENPNYGLGITLNTEDTYVIFCSSDYYQAGYRPYLIYSYPVKSENRTLISNKSLGRIKSVFR